MISIIILAIIQALTEFIPVSSSGHLIAVQEIFDLKGSLAVDVALHFGTLLALLVYFAPRIKSILMDLRANGKLIKNLVLTSLPAVQVGYIFQDKFADDARSLGVVIVMMATVGFVMLFSEHKVFKVNKNLDKIEKVPYSSAILIGIGQALALIPGTSRAGITMLASKKIGLNNKLAAEYSFLAGVPVIAGASLKVALDQETSDILRENPLQVVVGVAVAFIVGLYALRFLIKYLSDNGLRIFGWYRLALAAILFVIWINQ